VRHVRAATRHLCQADLVQPDAVSQNQPRSSQPDLGEVFEVTTSDLRPHNRQFLLLLRGVGVHPRAAPGPLHDRFHQLRRAREDEARRVGVAQPAARRTIPPCEESIALGQSLDGRLTQTRRHTLASVHQCLPARVADARRLGHLE
jgi:hypothetical protein